MTESETLQAVLNKASLTAPVITGGFLPDSISTVGLVISLKANPVNESYIEDVKLVYKEPGPLLNGAITLLSESIEFCNQSLEAQEAGDLLTSDGYMQRVQASLDSLFSLREIGSGFAIIINALHFSFINKEGALFSRQQMVAIRQILKQTRSHPFINADRAAEATDSLEDAGLTVDPVLLAFLLTEAEESGLAKND
jgi:hypothetical protein